MTVLLHASLSLQGLLSHLLTLKVKLILLLSWRHLNGCQKLLHSVELGLGQFVHLLLHVLPLHLHALRHLLPHLLWGSLHQVLLLQAWISKLLVQLLRHCLLVELLLHLVVRQVRRVGDDRLLATRGLELKVRLVDQTHLRRVLLRNGPLLLHLQELLQLLVLQHRVLVEPRLLLYWSLLRARLGQRRALLNHHVLMLLLHLRRHVERLHVLRLLKLALDLLELRLHVVVLGLRCVEPFDLHLEKLVDVLLTLGL